MRISCPPTISPCYYGVDTPTREELIASSKTPEQICEFLGADSLGYVSLANLKQAVNDTENTFCTSCYTGVYPTDLVQLEVGSKKSGSEEIFRDSTNGSRIEDPAAERPVTVERES
jgi:glutamine phosphoribosylpyrophosphate amidotransferase